ncbi:hypothetical protein ACFQ60_02070 [Streptomyces zhihengii]
MTPDRGHRGSHELLLTTRTRPVLAGTLLPVPRARIAIASTLRFLLTAPDVATAITRGQQGMPRKRTVTLPPSPTRLIFTATLTSYATITCQESSLAHFLTAVQLPPDNRALTPPAPPPWPRLRPGSAPS